MRILQLTRKFPYPAIDGESLNLYSFNKAMVSNGVTFDILSFNTYKHYYEVNDLPDIENFYQEIQTVYLDNRIKVADALKNIFSPLPFHTVRYISEEFADKLKQVLVKYKYDFILIESLYLCNYNNILKEYTDAKLIYRAHNVEYEIWERLTKNTTNPIKKWYLGYLTKKLKRYEISILNNFDLFVALTKRDLDILIRNGLNKKSCILPAGVWMKNYNPEILENFDKIKISFLGSLDWLPNIEGIKWFLDNCWGELKSENKELELHIAGRNTPDWLYKYQDKFTFIHGEVEDSKKFLESCQITIVPLFSGSGMRLKILEALALGRVVITTGIGIEGIDAIENKEMLIANTKDEFINKIIYCTKNPSKIKKLGENGKLFFDKNYNILKLTNKFIDTLNNL